MTRLKGREVSRHISEVINVKDCVSCHLKGQKISFHFLHFRDTHGVIDSLKNLCCITIKVS